MVQTSDPETIWTLGAQLGEGPVWVEPDQALWFVDIKSQKIHRYDPSGGDRKSWDTPAQCGFVLPATGNRFVVGLQHGLHLFDPAGGSFTMIVDPEPEQPSNRLNDGTVDSMGRLWFGTMDDGQTEKTGRIYRLAKDGSAVRVSGECPITNGPAISPDGKILYHIDTAAGIIYACTIAADGSLDNCKELVRVDTSHGKPDGPTVDAEGCIWVGIYGGWCARRYSPAGELLHTVEFPVDAITKLAFGGADQKTVFATTARKHLSPGELAQQPQAGDLFAFTVDVPGLPAAVISEGIAD